MDWPMIGAVSAATIVAGVVTFEVVALVNSGPEPVRRAPDLTSYGSSVERSAYELPGFATGRPAQPMPSFPLMRLIDPDRTFPIEGEENPANQGPASALPKKTPAPTVSTKPAPTASTKMEPQGDSRTATLTTPEIKTAAPYAQPRQDQWRVIVTSKASYFNLGGHVDASGIVDSLATSHLRDALKTHRNFAQLPPDIKTHILTQNINLAKIAAYRGLLGIDDRTMEAEQGIRFERVASR